MTKNIQLLLSLICLLSIGQRAIGQTHWSCNPHAFQYDMTVYLTPYLNGKALTSLDGYEFAAFCNDECRGLVSLETIKGTNVKYGYLRVRSNTASGETITFKLYNTSTQEETLGITTLDFSSQSVIGRPSETKKVFIGNAFELGDINLDGLINVSDVVDLKESIIRGKTSQLDISVADINSDGFINVSDVTDLIESIVHKK